MSTSDRIEEEALGWVIKVGASDFDDWDGLTAWLDADVAHAVQFGRLREEDIRLATALTVQPMPMEAPSPSPLAANDPGARWTSHWPRWAAAAAVVALVPVGSLLLPNHRNPAMLITTAAGQPKTLTLADGTQIAMNGGSSLRVSRDGRRAELLSGEAHFDVVHDSAHPFQVQVGAARIRDVGTRFDIVRRKDGLSLAVGEGTVSFEVDGAEAIPVTAGHRLDLFGSDVLPGTVRPADVGAWRAGRLSYDDASFALVADDLARATGRTIQLAPSLASRRFTGTILLTDDDAALRARLEGLLGVKVTVVDGKWTLQPASHVAS